MAKEAGYTQFDTGGGGAGKKREEEDWWRREERKKPAPLKPMPVPLPVGPPAPGAPALPRQAAPQTRAPWAEPAPEQTYAPWAPVPETQQIPWQLYMHGPEPRGPGEQTFALPMDFQAPEPAKRAERAYPVAREPTPEIERYRHALPAPAKIPTDPSIILHDLESSPRYTQSVAELYMEMSRQPGPSPLPFGVAAEARRREEAGRTPLPPIDVKAPIEQLRETLFQGRAAATSGDLLSSLANWHERRAELDRDKGQFALAVRQDQLAAAARGDVGYTAIGYLGTLMEQPGYIARAAAGRYIQPIGTRFASATPEELDRGSTVLHGAAAEIEARERGFSIPKIIQHLGGMLEAGLAPRRAEARWNPQGLPVPRVPGEVREFLIARYGNTDSVQNAAAWAEAISFSGAERMLAAGERIIAGEDPMAVIMGHKIDLTHPTARDYEVYINWLEATQTRGQDVEAAALFVQQNGYLPGEAHSWRELAGSLWFDPTQILGYGDLVGFIGPSASMKRSIRTWTNTANMAMDLQKMDPATVKNWGRVLSVGLEQPVKAVGAMAGLEPGALRKAEALALGIDVARTADAAEVVKPASRLTRILHNLTHPLEFTPEAKATQIREPATMLATTLAPTVRSVDDAKILVKLLGESPAQLGELGLLPGSIANSAAVAQIKPVFRAISGEIDDFSSLSRERFSLVDFVDELAWKIRDTCDDLSGVSAAAKEPDLLFADSVRNFMRDFWMTLNPGYVVRNMTGDLATMSRDGLFVMDSWGHVVAYMERTPTQTSRLLGITEAGPLAGMKGGLAEAPYVGGAVKQFRRFIQTGEIPFTHSRIAQMFGLDKIVGGPTIAGEANRYARAYVVAHQRVDALWWKQYRVPQQLQDALGASEARRLWGNLQGTLGDQEAQLAIGEYVSGKRLKFGIEAFLDDPSDLSPTMKAEINTGLARALSIEDPTESRAAALKVLEDSIDDARRYTDQTIATGATPPVRKVVSAQETPQDVKEAVVGLGAMAEGMGVPKEQAMAGAQEVANAIRTADSTATDAELAALRRVREQQLPAQTSRAVVMDTRTSIESQRQSTRAAVDALRDQAWDEYHGHKEQGTQIWERYRADATTAWETFQEHSRAGMEQMENAVRRLGEGEPLSEVLPNYGLTLRSATERYEQLYAQLAERGEVLQLTEGPALTEFYRKLNLHRAANDTASDWTWRMAMENPGVDAIDIIYSAENDVTELARVARGQHDLALTKLHTGQLNYTDYLAAVDKAWDEFWTQAPHRMMQAASEIVDAGGLKEALVPSAFRDVAKKAGVKIADLAAIGRDGWRDLRDNAGRMVRAVQNEVMQTTGMRDAQWAGQVKSIIWPVDADDLAYWAGFTDPTKMSAEDWRTAAHLADTELRKWESMATDVGRRSRVAAYSGRQPELGVGALAEETVTAGALSRAQEAKLLQQYTQEARVEERKLIDWLLAQAGYQASEYGNYNLGQRQRLLQELGLGQLLETPGGAVSKIGDISPVRRQAIIDGMPEEVKALVGKHFAATTDDPLQAVVGQWARAKEEAEDWAEMIAGNVKPTTRNPQRFFEAEGYPILRFNRQRITELLDEAGPLYRRRDELENVRRFAAQRYDAWVGAPFDESTRLASTNWMAMDGSQVAAADRMHARQGMATAPRVADIAQAAEKQQVTALERLRETLLERGAWDDALDARQGKLTEDQIGAIRKWYKEEFRPLNHARALITADAARDMADFALLDYTQRRNFDTWVAQVVPYHFWYTRSARNWAARFAARPHILRQYLAYKKWMRRENEQRQYPSRLEGMLEVPAEFLPDWTGQRAFLDPGRYVWPFQSMMSPYAVEDLDEAGEHGLIDTVYRYGKVLGLEPFPHLKVALVAAGKIAMDPEEIYNFWPQTAPLQGVTSGLRELGVQQIPPGGFYLEAPIRRALGLVEAEPAGPYRVARQEVGMQFERLAAGQPGGQRTMLMALELVYAIEHKELRAGEAMGLPQGDILAPQEPGTVVTEKLRLMAEKNGWTPEELKAAQQMLAQATQRAALERATATVPGYMGMPAYLYTPGEEMARQGQREYAAQGYSPLTGLGSRALREEYLESHPEVRGRPLTYGLLPGVAEGAMGPQETLNYMDYTVTKEQIDQRYTDQIDEYILRNPWDSAGAGALRQEHGAALAAARQQIMGAAGEYEEGALWSVYGATPEERKKRRLEQVVSMVAYNEPDMAGYTDPETGEIDYEAWERAVKGYYRDLAERFVDHPLLAELGQEAGATDPEAFAREVFGTVTEKDVKEYRRRNDTPVEAAQRTWNELYSAGWEAYAEAVEKGMDKNTAYRVFIEGIPGMTGQALAQAVQKEYPGRWTDEELREGLAGLEFPSGDEVHTLRKPQAEQELDRARDEFYQWYSWHVPPGQFEYDMRDAIPLLNAIKDFTTREALDESGFTAEQYREALKMVQAYVEGNLPEEPMKGQYAQEYTFARGMNRIFTRYRESKFPGMADLLGERAAKWGNRYLSKQEMAARDAFDKAHPEIEVYREWEKAFAMEHPMWAKYYKPWLLEEEEEGEGKGEGKVKAAGGRGGYYGGGGQGYYGGGFGSWADFASVLDMETMTELFRYWGEGRALSQAARAALTALHDKYGWGELEEWLAWLQRLYARAFESQARNVPRAQYTHWIPGVWRT